MKRVGLALLFLVFSVNLIFAALDLPAPPPAPDMGGSNNSTVGGSPNDYAYAQGSAVVNSSGAVSDGKLQSSGAYWAIFIGVLVLAALIAWFVIYSRRK